MTGRTADSGADRFDDEINNYMLNSNIDGNFSGMSISAKIRIRGCPQDWMSDGPTVKNHRFRPVVNLKLNKQLPIKYRY